MERLILFIILVSFCIAWIRGILNDKSLMYYLLVRDPVNRYIKHRNDRGTIEEYEKSLLQRRNFCLFLGIAILAGGTLILIVS